MRCVLKRIDRGVLMLSNTVFVMKTKKDSTIKRKFRMHLSNRFFSGPDEVPVTLISTRCSYCLAGFAYQSRMPCIKFCSFIDSNTLTFGFLTRFPLNSYHWLPLMTQRHIWTQLRLRRFGASDFDPNTIDHSFSNVKIASKFERKFVGECHRHCHTFPVDSVFCTMNGHTDVLPRGRG